MDVGQLTQGDPVLSDLAGIESQVLLVPKLMLLPLHQVPQQGMICQVQVIQPFAEGTAPLGFDMAEYTLVWGSFLSKDWCLSPSLIFPDCFKLFLLSSSSSYSSSSSSSPKPSSLFFLPPTLLLLHPKPILFPSISKQA